MARGGDHRDFRAIAEFDRPAAARQFFRSAHVPEIHDVRAMHAQPRSRQPLLQIVEFHVME